MGSEVTTMRTQIETAIKNLQSYLLEVAKYEHFSGELFSADPIEHWNGQITKTFTVLPDESIRQLENSLKEALPAGTPISSIRAQTAAHLMGLLINPKPPVFAETDTGDEIKNLYLSLYCPGLHLPNNQNKPSVSMGIFDVTALVRTIATLRLLCYFVEHIEALLKPENALNSFSLKWLQQQVTATCDIAAHPDKHVTYTQDFPFWEKVPIPSIQQVPSEQLAVLSPWQQLWRFHRTINYQNRIAYLSEYYIQTINLDRVSIPTQWFYRFIFWLHLPYCLDIFYDLYVIPLKGLIPAMYDFIRAARSDISEVLFALMINMCKLVISPIVVLSMFAQGLTSLPFTFIRFFFPHTFVRNIKGAILNFIEIIKDILLGWYALNTLATLTEPWFGYLPEILFSRTSSFYNLFNFTLMLYSLLYSLSQLIRSREKFWFASFPITLGFWYFQHPLPLFLSNTFALGLLSTGLLLGTRVAFQGYTLVHAMAEKIREVYHASKQRKLAAHLNLIPYTAVAEPDLQMQINPALLLSQPTTQFPPFLPSLPEQNPNDFQDKLTLMP